MKERPIMFSGPMVRAILAGRKTQTRRVARFEQIEPGVNLSFSGLVAGNYATGVPSSGWVLRSRGGGFGCWSDRTQPLRCPYGVPGDRLWVREAWRVAGWRDGMPLLIEYRDGATAEENEAACDAPGYEDLYERLVIQCAEDCERAGLPIGDDDCYQIPNGGLPTRWRPSIYMPRWASRIALEVEDVRVERVQAISEADAIAEGTTCWSCSGPVNGSSEEDCHCFHTKREAVPSFEMLWDSINAARGFGWNENPWVWVVKFRHLDTDHRPTTDAQQRATD